MNFEKDNEETSDRLVGTGGYATNVLGDEDDDDVKG